VRFSAGVAASAAFLGLSPAAVAMAVPLSGELSVERASGAEDCPDRAALATMVGRILKGADDGSGLGGAGGDVRAEVQFARAPLGYRATLRLEGARVGERTLTDTGATCTALGRAVSITLALLLDPAQADPPADAPVAVAVSSPPPVVAPTAASGVSAGFLAVTGGSALGLVGAPSAAGGLELDLRFGRRLWLQAAGQYVTGRSSPFETGSVEVSLVAARLHVCGVLNPAPALAQVLVAACVVGLGGQLRGEGTGFPSSNEAELAWFGAGGGLQASRLLGGRWLLGAGADLIAPLRRYTFSVENRGVAYRSNAVSATLQLSIGVKIW
jgi:hypothetical protein